VGINLRMHIIVINLVQWEQLQTESNEHEFVKQNEVLFFTEETENRLREAGLYPDIM
jgi:hypothetical protein